MTTNSDDLIEGDIYLSVAYGPVQYEGKCSLKRSPSQVGHKFKLRPYVANSTFVYLIPEEVQLFLKP